MYVSLKFHHPPYDLFARFQNHDFFAVRQTDHGIGGGFNVFDQVAIQDDLRVVYSGEVDHSGLSIGTSVATLPDSRVSPQTLEIERNAADMLLMTGVLSSADTAVDLQARRLLRAWQSGDVPTLDAEVTRSLQFDGACSTSLDEERLAVLQGIASHMQALAHDSDLHHTDIRGRVYAQLLSHLANRIQ
jgi:hypothetical protein